MYVTTQDFINNWATLSTVVMQLLLCKQSKCLLINITYVRQTVNIYSSYIIIAVYILDGYMYV